MTSGRVSTRAVEALLALLAGLTLALCLTASTASADQSTVAGALLALAVAALVRAAHECAELVSRTTPRAVAARRPVPLVLATRTTDPTHHPLRPRAPGRS